MRLTKFGHACVRIEHGDAVVVLDPGGFTEREAVDGASAVLVTHEHADHLDIDHLRATDAPVYTIESVRAAIAAADGDVAERVRVVAPGEHFDVGVPVTAVGELHAVIHEDIPRVSNSGYLLDVAGTGVFHPGDALTAPEDGRTVDVLLLPVHAPWSKISEVIDFARQIGARRSYAVHDGLLNDTGHAIVGRNLHLLLDDDDHGYERIEPGHDLEV
jgi:L-ascorbate metabolism protein UlaG (beta-lactamase superfamily)